MDILPRHVAIIPDGNRRWAKEHGLPSFEGHRRGVETSKAISRKAREMGIKVLSFWGFSTENWQRSREEVGFLMGLFEKLIDDSLKEAVEEETRIVHIGRKDRIPEGLRKRIENTEEKTRGFDKNFLVIGLDYGGRDEVLRAFERMRAAAPPSLTENDFFQYLDTKDLPYPQVDLIIRTSGEQRTSGMYIWQAAYAEYIFIKQHFPDFTPEIFEECIKEYGARQRRFGK